MDAPLWGAAAIAEAANLFKKNKKNKKNGKIEPDERAAYYLLETGAIKAKRVIGRNKNGQEKSRGQWVSTPRLIRNSLLPGASA